MCTNRHWVVYFNNSRLYFLQIGIEQIFSKRIKRSLAAEDHVTKPTGIC